MLKKGMEIQVLLVLSQVCKRSVKQKFVIWVRILWAVVSGGKKDYIFFSCCWLAIDNANLNFNFFKKESGEQN